MTNNELIERYIYAVTRRLPVKMRGDIDKELSGLIADMLEERCGDMTPTETDVRVVLTELGTPSQLAAKYDPNGECSLIGPKYFPVYLRVLTITLTAGSIGMVIAMIMSVITGEVTGTWIEMLCEALANIWNTLLAAFAMVTAVFAFLEYKKVDISSDEDLMKLPTVPSDKEKISRADSVVSIVFGVVLLVIVLFAPQLLGAYITKAGSESGVTLVPIFNTDTIRSMWYLFVIGFGADIFNSCYRLIIGRYNLKVAVVTAITSIINTVSAAFILLNDKVMNPEFGQLFAEAVAADGGPSELAPFVSEFASTFFIIILLANCAGTAKAFIKACKYRENN